MVGTPTIRHRELQQQSKELQQLAAKLHATPKHSAEEREAKRAIKEFGERLGGVRMAEVYDVAYATYGAHAVRGVSAAWTLVHGWNA
jgi:predicted HAD superfamily Cof-like phosphohydrolase